MSKNFNVQLVSALSTLQVQQFQNDLISLKFISDLRLENGKAVVRGVLPTPSPIFQVQLEANIKNALFNLPLVKEVDIEFKSEIPDGKGAEGKQSIPGIKNIIAVSSGKGGVGKSTVAVNLAVTFANWGAKVGLLDTDVYGPNVPIMVGVDQDPIVQGQNLVPHTAYSVKVMSIGFLNRGDRPVVWRGPMLHTAVKQFLYDVLWGELDYLIVDMPPGTGDAQLSLAQLVPVQGAVLVTTPQEVSMADVRKAINMFEQVRIPVLGIVENMSYFICQNCSTKHFIFGSGGGDELARKFKKNLLGQIPLSTNVREGGDAGLPIVIGDKASPQAHAFQQIADNVAIEISKLALDSPNLPIINLGDARGDSFTV
jgi:ATP-binding protein involved in chromosome partitioning